MLIDVRQWCTQANEARCVAMRGMGSGGVKNDTIPFYNSNLVEALHDVAQLYLEQGLGPPEVACDPRMCCNTLCPMQSSTGVSCVACDDPWLHAAVFGYPEPSL